MSSAPSTMITPDNCPRDEAGLRLLSRIVRYRLALSLGLFTNETPAESAFAAAEDNVQITTLLTALQARDAQMNGHQPPQPMQPQQYAPAPQQQQYAPAPLTPQPLAVAQAPAPGGYGAPPPMPLQPMAPAPGQQYAPPPPMPQAAPPAMPPQYAPPPPQQPPAMPPAPQAAPPPAYAPPPPAYAPPPGAPPAMMPPAPPAYAPQAAPQGYAPPPPPVQQYQPPQQQQPAPPPAAPPMARQPSTMGDPGNVGSAQARDRIAELEATVLGMARTQNMQFNLILNLAQHIFGLDKQTIATQLIQHAQAGEPMRFFEIQPGKAG